DRAPCRPSGASSSRGRAASTSRSPVSRWRTSPRSSSRSTTADTHRGPMPCGAPEKGCMRVTWVQPEDVLRHELIQSAVEGKPTEAVAARWTAAGGRLGAPERGASADAATPAQRRLARSLIDELDALSAPAPDDEPTEFNA